MASSSLDATPSKPLHLRVGILGSADIAQKVWASIHYAGHRVTFVGSRDLQRGEEFVKTMTEKLSGNSAPAESPEFVAPRIGSYEDVVSSADVDVVYIPIPVTTRDPWVKAAMNAGKHVVGEKPTARCADELQTWLDLAREKNVLYMDGTMFTHGLRLKKVKEAIAACGGDIAHIEAQVCLYPDDVSFFEKNIRMHPELEPHGALGDLGWYCLRWTLHALDFAKPTAIRHAAITKRCEKTHAILSFEGSLEFKSKSTITSVSFYCSMSDDRPQVTRIYMANGTLITIPDSIAPPPSSEPYFLIEKKHHTSDGAAPSYDRLTHEDLKAYEAKSGVEKIVVEVNGNFQTEQMWRDVAGALVERAEGERPLITDRDKAEKYAEYAYATQKLLDDVLAVASAAAE